MSDTAIMVASCTHHWVLDPPQGALVHGVCSKCGAKRDFPGDLESTPLRRSSWPPGERQTEVTTVGTPASKGMVRNRKWYDQNKQAILTDLEQLGNEGACTKWNMRASTLLGLLKRWSGERKNNPPSFSNRLSPGNRSQADNERAHLYANKILAALIDQGLVSKNYLAVGLCIVEVLSELLQPSEQE